MARIEVRTPEVERIYEKGRQAVLDAGGAISDGSLQGNKSGKSARLLVHVSAARFAELVGKFKEEGKVLTDTLNTRLPPTSLDGKIQPLDERAEIEFLLQTPPSLIEEEASLGKVLGALGWSVEKLFVGIFLAGPWVLLVFVVWYFYRRHRRRKAAA